MPEIMNLLEIERLNEIYEVRLTPEFIEVTFHFKQKKVVPKKEYLKLFINNGLI